MTATTVVIVRLFTGSNGTSFVCLNRSSALGSGTAFRTAESIASSLFALVASAAPKMISSGFVLSNGIGVVSVSLFWVSVPVLSLQRMSTPASSSIADRRETIAFCFDSASAPSASVTDITAGSATGTDATSRTRMNWVIWPATSQLQ